jgi:hypothetical protein
MVYKMRNVRGQTTDTNWPLDLRHPEPPTQNIEEPFFRGATISAHLRRRLLAVENQLLSLSKRKKLIISYLLVRLGESKMKNLSGYFVGQLIIIILLCSAGIPLTVCEELKSGNATIDLGDGYSASFVLPDIGKSYIVENAHIRGRSENESFKPYGFTISSCGIMLVDVGMYVYSNPQLISIPEAGINDSVLPGVTGPRVIIPRNISYAPGYVGYDLQINATELNARNPMAGFFLCYPGSWKELNDFKGIVEVIGETSVFPASDDSMKVFNFLVESIKISGPGI